MRFPLPYALLAGCLASVANSLPQTSNNLETTTTTVCNNSPSLCGRAYDSITHMGAHNSAFVRDSTTDNSLAGNQYFNATEALDAGVRLLQAQVHRVETELRLCHTSCRLLDAGTVSDWLAGINTWMTANQNDVVTILLVNAADATADEFGAVFKNSSISQWAYTPGGTGWPTLMEMITKRQRLVSFVTNISPSLNVPHILPEFDHVFETPFDIHELNGFNCTVDRPSRIESAAEGLQAGMMGLVNHFKYQKLTGGIQVPDVDMIETVNNPVGQTTETLGGHLTTCRKQWGVQPNYVLVDFFDKAGAIAAVDAMNGVSGDISGRSAPQSNDSGSKSGAVGRMNGGLGAGGLGLSLFVVLVAMVACL